MSAPPAARYLTDVDTRNHLGVDASLNVYVNRKRSLRIDDPYNCGPSDIVTGAETVFMNNKKSARKTDFIESMHSIAAGSPNVFIGSATPPTKVTVKVHGLVGGDEAQITVDGANPISTSGGQLILS